MCRDWRLVGAVVSELLMGSHPLPFEEWVFVFDHLRCRDLLVPSLPFSSLLFYALPFCRQGVPLVLQAPLLLLRIWTS